ncbi:T9SS-dependent M36 family metallopeptidase [Vaginella massiliensis]|uniref:T9SS-dependent M36 family metallopeptidase n=1 Tax=Vaginella massiliensis TaxID=1816680 RepID=UPI0008380034|nr:T9SS-dependent M36 family metallopeptidase [Vaginella massiliensis]
MKKKFLLLSSVVLLSVPTFAQDYKTQIQQFLNQNQFTSTVSNLDFSIVETIPNAKNKSERVFVQFEYEGIPIYNAYGNFTFKENNVLHFAGKESLNLQSNQFASQKNQLSTADLLDKVGQYFNLSTYVIKKDETIKNQGVYVYDEFDSKIYYYLHTDQVYHLVKEFMVQVKTEKSNDGHMVLVDVNTGKVLHEHSVTLSCDFHPHTFANFEEDQNSQDYSWLTAEFAMDSSDPKYKVFALPIEAPNAGSSSINSYSAIANTTASPEGWHKYAGTLEPSTYGNNVRASHDHSSVGYNSYSAYSVTLDGKVKGNDNYEFNFDYNHNSHPFKSKDAATTNLFYMNNMMHDIMYNYGFDEVNGNFQKRNFERGGAENDEVIALAQTRYNEGVLNNATFATYPDGYLARMAMFLWNPPASYVEYLVSVTSPSAIAGNYQGVKASFGPSLDQTVSGNFVIARTTSDSSTYEGCTTLSNATDIAGNIAVIQRGNCDFVTKVKNAQNAGAKAVIMVNNAAGDPIVMGGTDSTITIPSVMVKQNDGASFISTLSGGTTVSGRLNESDTPYIDGSLDNGIIAHEYGHGISTRLTGPLSSSSCLINLEQMGEGWSDYFALILTMQPGDTRSKARGIGTFAINQTTQGGGIRPTKYSTDMSVNPSTYAYIKNYGNADSPHRTGYVWATMLWDFTWDLIDKYGFSPDIYNGTAGNNIALQLVMDGLKMQPCNPGFVDGRDAILAADEANNNGENKCEIWSAFARRGLGYSANQGSANSRTDGTAAFDMPPADVLNCELSTAKISSTDLQIFPNPVKDVVYISDTTFGPTIHVEVLDVTGRKVATQTLKVAASRTQLDTSKLDAGVYILKIDTGKEIVTKKLIKK